MKHILRSIFRNRLSSSVIFISLATGIACINLIVLFISYELDTDYFHANSKQIYTLQSDHPFGEGKIYQCRFGGAEYMKQNLSSIEDFCRVWHSGTGKIVVNNDVYFDSPRIMSTSKNFFSFFSYELLTQNPETVLEVANNVVISDQLAYKYFGLETAIGQIISLYNKGKEEKLIVTGVFTKPVHNTQIDFDIVRPLGNKEVDTYCYVRLSDDVDKAEVEAFFKANTGVIPVVYAETPGSYYLQALNETYFVATGKSGIWLSRNKTVLLIALVIGFLILLIAILNYLGLTQNKLIEKNKEYAIRRINGGSKFRLLINFMTESLIIIGASFMASVFLMIWMFPFFNELVGTYITFDLLFQGKQMLLLLAVVVLLFLLTFLFAYYRIESRFKSNTLAIDDIQNKRRSLLPVFNIFQLAITVILIICSFIIYKQINFISEKSIGLDKSVLEVKLPSQHAKLASIFRDELKTDVSVEKISITNASPVLEYYIVFLEYELDGKLMKYVPAMFEGDENYTSTLGIELVKGDGFSGNPAVDKNKCLVNESLAKLFPEMDLIGNILPGGSKDQIVAGIVKDFHYSSLKSVVEPAIISYKNSGFHLLVKPLNSDDMFTQEAINKVWNKLIPDYPLNIESVGDRYEWYHRDNINQVKLLGSCCLISILLAMIGLFAHSYQTSGYRTKEIGIRKVNGAKTHEVIVMLNGDFLKWVLLAFVIACPVAYYAMDKWLQNFAYKTELSWWIFALAGIIAMGISLLTVSLQSWKAATRNPVDCLRYE